MNKRGVLQNELSRVIADAGLPVCPNIILISGVVF